MNFIGGFAVTPNDSADLAEKARVLIPGANGTIAVQCVNGDSFTITGAIAGHQYQVPPVIRVLATGTTATNIIALY